MCGGAMIHNPPCQRDGMKLQGIEKFERLVNDDFQGVSSFGTRQRRNNAEKKEKSRDAARERRAKESDYFQELEDLLPMVGAAPASLSVDKTSLIRLTLAHIKTRQFVELGLPKTAGKEEVDSTVDQVDLLSCVSGFSLVLGSFGDLIHVSNNVHKYIGLTSTELTGQVLADYVHPCDHRQLDQLTPSMEGETVEQQVEVSLRMKCTVTERGRIINLKQASYKSLKVSGKAKRMPCPEEGAGGLVGTVFMGLASLVWPQSGPPSQMGVFSSKHSQDMLFMEAENWFSSVAGYPISQILGQSFFAFVHTGDIAKVQTSFKNLVEQGQCETQAYRLLVSGGGWAWVKTAANMTSARKGGSKRQTITCMHQQITEVQDRDKILALVQMETEIGTGQKDKAQQQQTQRKASSETVEAFHLIKEEKQEIVNSKDIIFDCPSFEPLELMKEILSEGRQIELGGKENDVQNEPKVSVISSTSQPTSVIVSRRTSEGPKAVTQSLFKKIDSKTPSNPEKAEVHAPKAVTSSFFCKPEKVDAMTLNGNENLALNRNENMPMQDFEISTLDDDIFASLLAFNSVDDLDTLAPHGGDDYVTIKCLSQPDTIQIKDLDENYSDKGIKANLAPLEKKSTSVIVNPKTSEGPKVVTQSLFKKMNTRPDTDGIDAKTSSNAEKAKDITPKSATASFFCKPQNVDTTELNNDESMQIKDFGMYDEILASLPAFDNVEDVDNVAAQGGDDFVTIKNHLEPDVTDIEYLTQNILHEGIEDYLMLLGKNPIHYSFEEKTETVLTTSGADTMWGGPIKISPHQSFLSPVSQPGGLTLKPGKLLTHNSSNITTNQWAGDNWQGTWFWGQ